MISKKEEWHTWKHLNQPVRFFGLTGSQLGLAVLIPIIFMGVQFFFALGLIVAELMIIGRINNLQKKGDLFPLRTKRVRGSTPVLVQDTDGFYDMLIRDEEESI